jgi:L-lysine exporter family protein LysE/ArgO
VITSGAATTFTAGLALGLSLIVAVGAQNTFVLRQGVSRKHVAIVVLICAVSDAILIAIGVAGAGAAVRGESGLLTALQILGAALLLAYAVFAMRRALQPSSALLGGAVKSSRQAVIGATLAFTWLNPAVYVDTVAVGSVATTHGAYRWWFAAGATLASLLWFPSLGYGAGLLSRLLRRPGAVRGLELFVAVTMVVSAVRVATG